MYVARSHADFNDSLNKLAGSDNNQYATPWPMSINSGRSYMHNNFMQVGRMVAASALTGTLPKSALVAETKFSPMQKATLSALATSTTEQEYKAALIAAIKHGALTNTAAQVLSKPNARNYTKKITPQIALSNAEPTPVSLQTSAQNNHMSDVFEAEKMALDAFEAENMAIETSALEENALQDFEPKHNAVISNVTPDVVSTVDAPIVDLQPNVPSSPQLRSPNANLLAPRKMNRGNAVVQARKRKPRKESVS